MERAFYLVIQYNLILTDKEILPAAVSDGASYVKTCANIYKLLDCYASTYFKVVIYQ